jgi:membrane fusion protein (multidrug efflux system)
MSDPKTSDDSSDVLALVRGLYDEQQRLRLQYDRLANRVEDLIEVVPQNGTESGQSTPESKPAEQGKHQDDPAPKNGEEPASRFQSVRRRLDAIGRHRGALIAALLILLVLIFAGVKIWLYLHSYESTDDAQINGYIHPIGARISGTVERVLVDNNQSVRAGQLLVKIDPRDYQNALDQARAALGEANAQALAAEADYKTSVAQLALAVASNVLSQKDLVRDRYLKASHVMPPEQYDAALAQAREAAAKVSADRAAVASSYGTALSREASVKQAQASEDEAALNLSYTDVYAPVDGVIGERSAESGQAVTPGQELLAVVPIDNLWVTANFMETQLRRMRRGQPVSIHVDALDRDYDGYVDDFAGATGSLFSLLPPENATGNYVKVVQRLPVRINIRPGENQDRRLRPGMSVEPTVWLR